MTTLPRTGHDDSLLALHGDSELAVGLIDLAVNVRATPSWLRDRLAGIDIARYPDPAPGVAAVATRHARPTDEVLLTAGGAEAFTLIARALAPRHAVVVHPQFTEPELALRAAGHDVDRVVLEWPFVLAAADVPDSADLVILGNPTNPTSVLHPADTIRALARPNRVLVVDEAFADGIVGESESLASARDVPGLVVVRSLTKTWGLAGVRAGYVIADASLIARLAAQQPRWSVSALAVEAALACSSPDALAEASHAAAQNAVDRAYLIERLAPFAAVVPDQQAAFVLARFKRFDVREALRERGFAVRRGDTFPGLGPEWIRIAVRDRQTSYALVQALASILEGTE